ncbi:hypothetical protein ABIA39_008979 [Nocardia sp. GAS34]
MPLSTRSIAYAIDKWPGLVSKPMASDPPTLLIADRAHPRACGEHRIGVDGEVLQRGSSPRVRGASRRIGEFAVVTGLIPARAGSILLDLRCSGEMCWFSFTFVRCWLVSVSVSGCFAVSAGFAPAGARAAGFLLAGVGAQHQVDAVDVDGFPFVTVDAEGEALFVAGGVDHDGSAVFGEFYDALPGQFPDAGADYADEHSGAYLEEPAREVSAEAGWARCEYEDYHGTSSS